MEIRVIDFEELTKSFIPYVEGYKEIESEKKRMIDSIDPDRKKMEAIIRRSQSGLVVDEFSQKRDMEEFKSIQEKLMRLDNEFKTKLKEMNNNLNSDIYDKLSVIVSNWANKNSVDLVMGKMEVIFNTEDIDVTNKILDVLKEENLFYEETVVGYDIPTINL